MAKLELLQADYKTLSRTVVPKNGKPLLDKDSAFAPLFESILNVALEDDMDKH